MLGVGLEQNKSEESVLNDRETFRSWSSGSSISSYETTQSDAGDTELFYTYIEAAMASKERVIRSHF